MAESLFPLSNLKPARFHPLQLTTYENHLHSFSPLRYPARHGRFIRQTRRNLRFWGISPRISQVLNQTKPKTKMTTSKQASEMERANLTRLQIALIKNDPKKYTDKQIAEYIKTCK